MRPVRVDPCPPALAEAFAASVGPGVADAPLPANWNVAPTSDVYAVAIDGAGGRRLDAYRWGLIPSWAKNVKVGARMINARSETAATSSAFKAPFRKHRCLIPMDGTRSRGGYGTSASAGRLGRRDVGTWSA